jgi:hypothetical protein
MNDKEFSELELRATIVPQQVKWPAPEYLHWQKLHRCADEARERVAQAWAAFDAIDNDSDLSPEGRERKKKKVADEASAGFKESRTLTAAKEVVERQVAKWAERTGMATKPPTNIAEAVVQSEIRAHLAAIKDSKMSFLQRHVTDPRVASAVLGAPPFLSGLTDAEIAVVQKRIEEHVAPEVAEARNATLKALEQAEQGWQRAMNKIGERSGLSKGPDGTWCNPKMPEPAVA